MLTEKDLFKRLFWQGGAEDLNLF